LIYIIEVIKCTYLPAIVLVVYDTLLSLEEECLVIYRREMGKSGVLYGLARWFGLVLVIMAMINAIGNLSNKVGVRYVAANYAINPIALVGLIGCIANFLYPLKTISQATVPLSAT